MKNKALIAVIAVTLGTAGLILLFGMFVFLQPDVVTVVHHAAVVTPAYDEYQHSANGYPLGFGVAIMVAAVFTVILIAFDAWIDPRK